MTRELLEEELANVNDEIDRLVAMAGDRSDEDNKKLAEARARRLDLMARLRDYEEEKAAGVRSQLEGL